MDVELAATPAQVRQRRPPVLPMLSLLFLGLVALGAWFLISPALSGTRYYKVGYNRTAYEYMRQALLLSIPYGLVLFLWRRGGRVSLRLLLAGAAVLHLLVLFAPLPQSQDFYQYLFYGRMHAVHGANPFVVNPSRFWADPWFPWIRWNSIPSVYGPVWILLSAGVVKVAGGTLATAFVALKLVVLALDAAVVALILALSRDRADPEGAAGWGVLAYAWNPLVVLTVPLAGSADVAVAAALLGAVLARRRGRALPATVLLTLATLVKVYAGLALALHLVLVWRERRAARTAGHAGAALGLAAAAYWPYWAGLATFEGLVTAARLTNLSLAGAVQEAVLAPVLRLLGLPHWIGASQVVSRVVGFAVLAGAFVWAARRVRDQRSLWHGVLAVLFVYLLASHWFYYWYLLGPLALAAALPASALTDAVLLFGATSLVQLDLPGRWLTSVVQSGFRYAPPVACWALRSRRPAGATEVEAPAGIRPTGPVPAPMPLPSGGATPIPGRASAAR